MSAGQRLRGNVILSLIVLAAACAERRVEAPPPPPAELRQAELLPADLDVALRVDLGRLRNSLSTEVLGRLGALLLSGTDPAVSRAFDWALTRSHVVWLALRPAKRLGLVDNVIVFRGTFRGLAPDEFDGKATWSSGQELGGPWRLFERDPDQRFEPARLYVRDDNTLVLVSEAEIDSFERVLQDGAQDPRPVPAERGVVSVAVRLHTATERFERSFPRLGRHLRSANALRALLDTGADETSLQVEVQFSGEKTAQQASDAVRLLLLGLESSGAVGRLARASKVRSVADQVVVESHLGRELSAQWLGCLVFGEAC